MSDKIVYLVWSPEGCDRACTRDLLLKECAPSMLGLNPLALSMDVADPESDVRGPSPFHPREPRISGLINLRLSALEKRAPYEDILVRAGLRIAGYLVDESVYCDYGGNRHAAPRTWPDGVRSPGVTAVTLMERPKRLEREEWVKRWHGNMSPVSESIQPRTRYVRNLVLQALTPGAPPFEGIVEEVWPTPRHISNPFLFYGASHPLALARNLFRILRAVKAFLDLTRIRTTMMSEYFLKTDFQPPR